MTRTEGALARSLYFQFADRAISGFDLLKQLFGAGLQDARYLRIWQDVSQKVSP